MQRAPYLQDREIREAADRFRGQEGMKRYRALPIDVTLVAELILKLTPILLPNLLQDQQIDAALSPDLTSFYVDERSYKAWERGQRRENWEARRLRFSIAHEIGHYVLHKNIILANAFQSIAEFKAWAIDRTNYTSAEYQADEFAGRFLVPLEDLLKEYDYYILAEKHNPNLRETEGIRAEIASKIASRFGVNFQVIEVRLDREGIWPAE